MSIKNKILLSFIILVIVPTVLLTTYCYQQSYDMYCEQMLKVERRALNEENRELTYLFKKSADVATTIASDTNVIKILRKMNSKDYNIEEQITDFLVLKNIFNKLEFDFSLYRIRLYVPNHLYYANENINFFNIDNLIESEWYKNMSTSYSLVNWTAPYSFEYAPPDGEQRIYSTIKQVIDYHAPSFPLGFITVDILESELHNLLRGKELLNGNAFYIINNNNILASSNIETTLPNEFSLEYIIANADSSTSLTTKDGTCILLSSLIPNTPFTLVSLISSTSFKSSYLEISRNSILIAIIISCLSCIIAIFITNSITRRIHILSSAMSTVNKGDFSTYVSKIGRDEISILETSFNEMMVHIDKQIDDKVRIEQEKKNYELLTLQAQINPHFIYHIIEFINNKAMQHEDNELKCLINSLSRYYNLSLSNNSKTITIEEELSQIKTYVEIQNSILGHIITLEYLVDNDVLDSLIPRYLLQPLIENAIAHGIRMKDNTAGKIIIYGETDGNDIMLRVEDNGIGMDYEKVSKLLLRDTSTTPTSSYFGLNNIDQRLKQLYGYNYGLSIRSMKGVGTTVFIKIKVNKLHNK